MPDAHLLVVDDASPDGTGEIADGVARFDPAVRVLHRTGKEGLGAAYLARHEPSPRLILVGAVSPMRVAVSVISVLLASTRPGRGSRSGRRRRSGWWNDCDDGDRR